MVCSKNTFISNGQVFIQKAIDIYMSMQGLAILASQEE
jgi:hypothetical protein